MEKLLVVSYCKEPGCCPIDANLVPRPIFLLIWNGRRNILPGIDCKRMRTILAQNELKNTKGTGLVSCSAYYFVISILIPCHVCCNGKFEWLQLQFESALVYTLSPASIKRVCHSNKNIKKQSRFSLKEAILLCGSLQGMRNQTIL